LFGRLADGCEWGRVSLLVLARVYGIANESRTLMTKYSQAPEKAGMKGRRRFVADVSVDEDGRMPVVLDMRLPERDRVRCYCVSMFAAKEIAIALNERQQRRLDLKLGKKSEKVA
jgi:hypothetical protein